MVYIYIIRQSLWREIFLHRRVVEPLVTQSLIGCSAFGYRETARGQLCATMQSPFGFPSLFNNVVYSSPLIEYFLRTCRPVEKQSCKSQLKACLRPPLFHLWLGCAFEAVNFSHSLSDQSYPTTPKTVGAYIHISKTFSKSRCAIGIPNPLRLNACQQPTNDDRNCALVSVFESRSKVRQAALRFRILLLYCPPFFISESMTWCLCLIRSCVPVGPVKHKQI